MIKKRIAGTITVKNNKAVQSFSYKHYLPLGSVSAIVENLDRWGLDEIIILDIERTKNKTGPNLNLIKEVCSIPISTPLTYGGGITSVENALAVIGSGAERVIVDNLLINNPSQIKRISKAIGSQAVIASIPVKIEGNQAYHFNYVDKETFKLDIQKIKKLEGYISEIMVVDVDKQGIEGSFRNHLINEFSDIDLGLICFGGVGTSLKGSELLNHQFVKAVAYGNILNYGELFFQEIKKSLSKSKKNLRRSIYREKI